jgi:hypothetical protein
VKAIILTFDRYRAITEHMMLKYRELWPDHPFTFRIPYQRLDGSATKDREYVRTPDPIRETALTLLADLEDEECIHWFGETTERYLRDSILLQDEGAIPRDLGPTNGMDK